MPEELDDLEAVKTVIGALQGFEVADQERIIRWAQEKLGLTAARHPNVASAAPTQTETTPPATRGTDIKTFVTTKSPASANQFAATVAYYYRFEAPEHLRKDSITADDLQEACRLAGRERLARPAQTLIDALKQGLLDRGERGSYTVSTVGENLVAMALPSDTARVVTKKTRTTGSRTRQAKKSSRRRTR